jgi:hypothetical protein
MLKYCEYYFNTQEIYMSNMISNRISPAELGLVVQGLIRQQLIPPVKEALDALSALTEKEINPIDFDRSITHIASLVNEIDLNSFDQSLITVLKIESYNLKQHAKEISSDKVYNELFIRKLELLNAQAQCINGENQEKIKEIEKIYRDFQVVTEVLGLTINFHSSAIERLLTPRVIEGAVNHKIGATDPNRPALPLKQNNQNMPAPPQQTILSSFFPNQLFNNALNRSRMALHNCNQFTFTKAKTTVACAGISIASLEQLLLNPNDFLDDGRTFDQVLLKGRQNYLEALNLFNTNTKNGLLDVFSSAFLEGGIADVQSKINGMLRETLSDAPSFLEAATTLEVDSLKLIKVFTQGGFIATLNSLSQNELGFNQQGLIRYYNEQILPWAEEQKNTKPSDFANQLIENLLPGIQYKRVDGVCLNMDQGCEELAAKTMTRIGGGVIAKENGSAQHNYLKLLEILRDASLSQGSPVGAILHIGGAFFSISINLDGSVMISDSHGIGFARSVFTAPFAVVVAENIEDGSILLANHHTIEWKNPEIRNHQVVNNTYFLYALKDDLKESVIPINREAFPLKKQNVPQALQGKKGAVDSLSTLFVKNRPKPTKNSPEDIQKANIQGIKSILDHVSGKINYRFFVEKHLNDIKMDFDKLSQDLLDNNKTHPTADYLKSVFANGGLEAIVQEIEQKVYSFTTKAVGYYYLSLLPANEYVLSKQTVSGFIQKVEETLVAPQTQIVIKEKNTTPLHHTFSVQGKEPLSQEERLKQAFVRSLSVENRQKDTAVLNELIETLENFKNKINSNASWFERVSLKRKIQSFHDKMRPALKEYYLFLKGDVATKPEVLIEKIRGIQAAMLPQENG